MTGRETEEETDIHDTRYFLKKKIYRRGSEECAKAPSTVRSCQRARAECGKSLSFSSVSAGLKFVRKISSRNGVHGLDNSISALSDHRNYFDGTFSHHLLIFHRRPQKPRVTASEPNLRISPQRDDSRNRGANRTGLSCLFQPLTGPASLPASA